MVNNVMDEQEIINEKNIGEESIFTRKDIKWSNIYKIVVFHIIWAYALITFPYIQHYKTTLYIIFSIIFTGFGIGAGIHRLWSHKAYKATLPLKILLATAYLSSFQNAMHDWVRDHRTHHKYNETNGDPTNIKRGFFFAHMGWLMTKKHPDVINKGKLLDMSDIKEDPVITFVDKHLTILRITVTLVMIAIPVYLWNENWYYAAMSQYIKFMYVTNATWSLNSFSHMFGIRPYNKGIGAAENAVMDFMSHGEGWHNYHHTFPTDYRAPDMRFAFFDLTGTLIDGFAKIGWVYDRKVPSKSLVERTVNNRGDRALLLSMFAD